MTLKLGLISDPHATVAPVKASLALFKKQGVDRILCAGDIAGYGEQLEQTIQVLTESQCECIQGNHETWWLQRHRALRQTHAYQFLQALPKTREYSIAGKTLLMVHASPPDSQTEGIKLLDLNGEILTQEKSVWSEKLAGCTFDIVIVGHTHQVFAQKLSNVLVINPGSTLFNHSCAILTLPACQLDWYALSNQPIVKSWNWGMIAAQ